MPSQLIVMVITSYLRGFSVIAPKARAIIQRITIAMEKCAKSIISYVSLSLKRNASLYRGFRGDRPKHSNDIRKDVYQEQCGKHSANDFVEVIHWTIPDRLRCRS